MSHAVVYCVMLFALPGCLCKLQGKNFCVNIWNKNDLDFLKFTFVIFGHTELERKETGVEYVVLKPWVVCPNSGMY